MVKGLKICKLLIQSNKGKAMDEIQYEKWIIE
jgi:hypothetical protein